MPNRASTMHSWSFQHVNIMASRIGLEKTAVPLPLSQTSSRALLCTASLLFLANSGDDGLLKDFFNTNHFFAATFHILCTHLGGDGLALLPSDWRQTLRLQELDACSLCPKIRLETDQNQGS